jgi:hypothetical protein
MGLIRHPDQIQDRFKRCGFENSITGSENHLIKIRGVENYDINDEVMDDIKIDEEAHRSWGTEDEDRTKSEPEDQSESDLEEKEDHHEGQTKNCSNIF